MKEATHVRVGHNIYSADGSEHVNHKTTNAAKRWSRQFQKTGGAMGDGRVRVAAKRPG